MPHLIDKEYAVVPIDSVEPYPGNARKGADKDIDRSLDIHGQYRPLVVQKSTGYILAGNNTWHRLKAAGADVVKVTLEDVDDATARRINLADNATADAGEYDPEALLAALEMAAAADSLAAAGFDEEALATLRDEIDREEDPHVTVIEGEDPWDVPGAAGEDLQAKWGTAPGQTWTLKASEAKASAGGDGAADPHLLHIPADAQATNDESHPAAGLAGLAGLPAYALWLEVPEALDGDDLDHFLDRTLQAAEGALTDGSPFYIAHHSDGRSMPVVRALLAGDWHMQATLLLTRFAPNEHARDAAGRPFDFVDAYVPLTYGWKKGAPHRWYGGRDKDSVLTMGESFLPVPPETIAATLYNSTRLGDPVLQLAASNGALLEACDALGRRAVLVARGPEAAATILEAADRGGLVPLRVEDAPVEAPQSEAENELAAAAGEGDLRSPGSPSPA